MNEPKPWLIQEGGLAQRLRALHDETGLNNKEFAQRLGWAESKVSRQRRGIITPSPDDLEQWARATGRPDIVDELGTLRRAALAHERTFKERMERGQAEVQRDYLRLVEESKLVRYFETAWIPGFLQTREYARAVFSEMQELHGPKDDIDEAIAERMKRQQLLYDPSRRFEFLVTEPALLVDWVTARIMVPQLHFLSTWLDAPNVRLGFLPMRGGNRRPWQNSFQMYDDLVIAEGFAAEAEQGRPDLHARLMDDMWELALTGEAARTFLAGAVKVWEA